jgi:hypothetical protein
MKRIMQLSLLLITLGFLTACATTANYQQALGQWQGENIQHLINVWGYPDSAIKLPSGNTVYLYSRQQTYITPPSSPMMTSGLWGFPGSPMAMGSYDGAMMGGQPVSMYCRTWFEVDPKGLIVNYRFQGNNCIASKNNRWAPTA